MLNYVRWRHGRIKFTSGVEEIKIFQPERQNRRGLSIILHRCGGNATPAHVMQMH
jgi:hypothetical protein